MYVIYKCQRDAACKRYVVISRYLIVNRHRSGFGKRRTCPKVIRSLCRTVLHGITLCRIGNCHGDAVRLSVHGSRHVICADSHRLGAYRNGNALGRPCVSFGLRSHDCDDCRAGFHDRDIAL